MADQGGVHRARVQGVVGALARREGVVGERVGKGELAQLIPGFPGLQHVVMVDVQVHRRPPGHVALAIAVDQGLGDPVPAEVLVQVRPLPHEPVLGGEFR